MFDWILSLLAGVAAAFLAYGWRPQRRWIALLAARVLSVLLATALFLDAPLGSRSRSPIVALDVSGSWTRGGDRAAFARAKAIAAQRSSEGRIAIYGDSLREASVGAIQLPSDSRSLVGPLVARAAASGRPVLLISDGEADDPEALRSLPAGSELLVLDRSPAVDLAVANLRLPRSALAGDTVRVGVDVAAGALPVPAGTLTFALDNLRLASVALDSMPPFGERSLEVHLRLPDRAGWALLRVVAQVPRDAEPSNDTLTAVLGVAREAQAVLVSTSPDLDVRALGTVLRGIVSLPTRGYLRVAPGQWREEGTLAAVSEDLVRQAVRNAPLLLLYGDTAFFGPPRALGAGGVLLVVPPGIESGEWFATGSAASPLSSLLAGLEWDSLAPLSVGPVPRGATFNLLEVRRARRLERSFVGSGWESPRRVVVVNASGFWRWRQHGGAAALAHAAFWSGILDWLAAEDRQRGIATGASFYREGDVLTWIRGRGADSVVQVVLQSLSTREPLVDTLHLNFGSGRAVVETPGLPRGVYRAVALRDSFLVAVNASRELLPRSPLLRSGAVGEIPPAGWERRLRGEPWAYVLLLLALLGEWLGRRRLGLR
jgi:hypothetical protein